MSYSFLFNKNQILQICWHFWMTSSCHYYANWAYIFQNSIYNVFLQDKGDIWTMSEEANAL